MSRTLIVENITDQPVLRADVVFEPKKARAVAVGEAGLKEVKACRFLRIVSEAEASDVAERFSLPALDGVAELVASAEAATERVRRAQQADHAAKVRRGSGQPSDIHVFGREIAATEKSKPKLSYVTIEQQRLAQERERRLTWLREQLAAAQAAERDVKQELSDATAAAGPVMEQARAALLDHRQRVTSAAQKQRAGILGTVAKAAETLDAALAELALLESSFAVAMAAEAKVPGLPPVEPLSPALADQRRLVAELQRVAIAPDARSARRSGLVPTAAPARGAPSWPS